MAEQPSGPPKLIIGDDWKRPAEAAAPATTPPSAKPSGAGIVVDSDWKSQAQAEKDRLVAAEQAKQAAGPAGGGGAGRGPGGKEMPPADFQSLLGTLVTQSLMYLGAFPDESGRAMVSLDYARFHIDLLGVLEAKTKGNLKPEEAADLAQALNELRLRYVDVTQVLADMARQRAAGGGGVAAGGQIPGGPGGGAIRL